MTAVRLLPFLLCVSCVTVANAVNPIPPPDCVSTCGTKVFHTKDCAGYDHREQVALDVLPFDRVTLCKTLSTWHVMIVPADSFPAFPTKEPVAGQTDCFYRAIYFAQMTWQSGALVHEIAHAAENCVDATHATWGAKGISDAIQKGHETP